MKDKIPGAAAVVILIIVGVLVVAFGWRKVSGADNDVTKETIDRYQGMVKQATSADGSKAGGGSQMTHGAPPANAPATNAGAPP